MNKHQLDLVKEQIKERVDEVEKSRPDGTSMVQKNKRKTKKIIR